VPLFPVIVMMGMSFLGLMAGPRKLLTDKQRQATFVLTCFLGGVTLGPMNWIAREANSAIFASAMSTTVAFALTPLITRGWIANALLSQALSSSLALLAVKFIAMRTFPEIKSSVSDPDAELADRVFDFVTAPIVLDGLLVMQFVGNAALVLLHTAPVLRGSSSMLNDYDTERNKDALDFVSSSRDALAIVTSVSYAVVRLFKACVESIARALKAAAQKGDNSAVASAVKMSVSDIDPTLDRLSLGVSSLTFFYIYVKFVQVIQDSDDPQQRFRTLAKLFRMLTPVRVVSAGRK
jgi:hypothetical protein